MAEKTKSSNETEVTIPHGPGQVITPTATNTTSSPTNTTVIEPKPVASPQPAMSPAPAAVTKKPEPVVEPAESTQYVQRKELAVPALVAESPKEQQAPKKGFFNNDDDGNSVADSPAKREIEPVAWTASEFVHHDKNASWYTILGAVSLVIAAGVYLLTRDVVSALVVLVAAFTLGFYGARRPRQLEYQLDSSGLSVGNKHFRYGEFKSFSVAKEGAFSSIILMPLKRFSQVTTLYLAPENEAEIIDILSGTLPFEDHKRDAVDKLMHKIRF